MAYLTAAFLGTNSHPLNLSPACIAVFADDVTGYATASSIGNMNNLLQTELMLMVE